MGKHRRAVLALGAIVLPPLGVAIDAGLGAALSSCGATNDVKLPSSDASTTGTAAPTGSSPDGGAPPGSGDDGEGTTTTGGDGGPAPPADAGSADGGDGGRDYSTDATKFFGASRCADAGVQLCEDFETGTLNTAVWKAQGTAPVIDTMQAARGTHALHITQQGNGLSYIKESVTFPEPHDTYFGRVFVYFKSLPTPPGMTYAHWTMIAASGTGIPGEIRVSGQLQSGKNLFGVGTDNEADGGSGDWTNSDRDPNGMPAAVPTNKWLCIEWMHKGDTNETAFWWDAVPHPSLATDAGVVHGGNPQNPYLLPQFNNVWVGWQEYQTSTEPFESWIDEIAIDVERIGCVL
ncbi:MAG TPA: hypothetical protein VHV30_05640 [Polyangiaceae bacterium]|jgi:hypothetical protein|nr:hypothetical protein [Polyangiaceae bacterium]